MKNNSLLLLILLCTHAAFALKKGSAKLVSIQGQITQTAAYCGGAQPSEEMLQQMAKPKPFPNKEIVIKIGPKNKVGNAVYKRIVTDQDGKFTVRLKSNMVYCFIEDWKAKPFKVPQNTEFVQWDAACLYERYLLADYVLKVQNKENALVQINFHKPCFFNPYCGTYSGPLPP